MTQVSLDEVQGNVLYAYGTAFPVARYRFLSIDEHRGADASRVIAGWANRVTFGKPSDYRRVATHVNLAFTGSGLEALGVPAEMLDGFPDDFRDGAFARSPVVGDSGPNACDAWEPGFGDAHVLLIVHGKESGTVSDLGDELEAEAAGAMTPVGPPQQAGLLPGDGERDGDSCGVAFSREHFGFADGCSQPAIEGVDTDKEGDGVHGRVLRKGTLPNVLQDVGLVKEKRRWRLIRTGEFLLGYESEDGRPADGPPSPLGPNGTFMVYRKLYQDVEAFHHHIAKCAGPLGMSENDLAAKIIGRTVDGVPLSRPDDRAATDRKLANAFDYEEDRWGHGCPVGAHIRRTNPRDALPGRGEVTMRHRMIRRGMPYGPRWTGTGDDAERGLIFICFTASIQKGFEFVQTVWCNDGEAFGLGAEPDFVMQQPDDSGEMTGSMLIPVRGQVPKRLVPPERPLVLVRGCEYLFVPSRRACAWLGDPERDVTNAVGGDGE